MTDTVSFFNTVADVQQVENLVNSLNKLERTVVNTARGKSDGIKELEGKLKSLGTVGVSAVQTAAANLGSALSQLEGLQSRYATIDAKFQTSTGKQQTELARHLNAILTSIVKTKGLIIEEMSNLQSAIASNKSGGLLNLNAQAHSQWVNSILPDRKTFEAALQQRAATLKAVANTAIMQLQPELIKPSASFSTVSTNRLNIVATELVDMVYPPKALFEAELARRQKTLMLAANTARAQLEAAMAKPSGTYQSVSFGSNGAVAGAIKETTHKVTGLSKAFQTLGIDMNTVHSAARGLSAGFGGLWLTWGQMVPLMAGAAVSFGMKSVISLGAQVQDTFTQIRVLAGLSTEEVRVLNEQMHVLGSTGPFGPMAMAEAMKTLALAGMKANEVLLAMPEVKNFALAGTIDLQKAADAMTTVGVAFSIEAKNYGYISDVLTKAAAESKSSVEGMAEAFKTASVINHQYGVSLEDTAIGLSLLANAGIHHTAAGTALRNMYADLAERTPKVAKAMRELGVAAKDSTGLMREQGEIFKDLMNALSEKSPLDASKYIQTIFSERGGKAAMEILTALKKASKETGTDVKNLYDELAKNIANSAGFAATAAAEMTLTPLNQMKAVGSALQSSLIETFDQLSPTVLEMSKKLQNLFRSDSFKEGIAEIINAVSQATTFIFDHIKTIGNLVLGYQALKGVLTVAASALMMIGTAAEASAAGLGAMGVAMQVVTKGNPLLLILSGIAAAGAAAWALWAVNSDRAREADKKFVDNSGDLLAELQKELDRRNQINEAKRLGISLLELEQRQKLTVAIGTKSRGVIEAEQALKAAQNPSGWSIALGMLDPAGAEAERLNNITKAQKRLNDAIEMEKEQKDQLLLVTRQLQVDSERQAAEVKKQEKDRRDAIQNGIADMMKQVPAYKAVREASDNTLATIVKNLDTELKAINDKVSQERAINKAAYEAREIEQGTYLAKEVNAIEYAEAAKLAKMQEALDKYTEEYQRRSAEIQAAAAERRAATVNPKGGELEQQARDLKGELVSLANTATAEMSKMRSAIDSVQGEAFKELSVQASKSRSEVRKLREEAEKFWLAEERSREKADSKSALEESVRYLNPGVAAGIQAQAAEMEKYADKINETELAYQRASNAVDDFLKGVDPANMTEGQWLIYQTLSENLKDIVALRDKLAAGSSLAELLALKAGEAAQLGVDRATIARITTDVAAAIELGLFEGGKKGAKALRALVVAELTKPVRLIVQAVINPIVGAITGSLGLTGVANAAGAAGGSTGGLLNAASTGIGLAGMGSAMGSSFGAAFGATMAGEMGSAFASGVAMLGMEGGVMTGLSTIAGALGPIALGLAAVYAISKQLDHSGTPHTGGGSKYSASGGLVSTPVGGWTGGTTWGDGFGSVVGSQDATDMTAKLAKSIVGILDTTAVTFGKTAGYMAATSFADDSSKDPAWGSLVIKQMDNVLVNWADTRSSKWAPRTFSDGSAGSAEYLAAVSADVRKAIDGIGIPAWATDMLNALGDSPGLDKLAEVMTTINATQGVLKYMKDNLVGFSAISDNAALKLLNASGGVQALTANASAYYDNFYTDAEKSANTLTTVRKAFEAVNVPMPATREEFRKLVEHLQATADTNPYASAALATVLSMAGAFASATEALSTTGETVVDTVDEVKELEKELDKLRNPMRSIADIAASTVKLETEGANLNITLLKAMGDSASLKEAEVQQRNLNIKGMTTQEIALYDLNAETQRRIDSINAERQAVADGVASWEHFFDVFGTTDEKQARAKSRVQAVLSPDIDTAAEFSREVYLLTEAFGVGSAEVKKLTDLADDFKIAFPGTADTVTEVMESLRNTSRSVSDVASNMLSLSDKVFELQNAGNTGALRGKILAGLSDVKDEVTGLSEQDLQNLVWSLEDAAEATKNLDAALTASDNERKGIENSLYQALGMTAQIRERELAALYPANRALQMLSHAVTDAQSSIADLTNTIAMLDGVIAEAKTTSNSLRVALGGQDQTEAELWNKLNSGAGTAAENLTTINSLLGIINNSITTDTTNAQNELTSSANAANDAIRATIETQLEAQKTQLDNAQKLVDFGKELADFVKNLQLGELSTATPGEKLALAQQEYNRNVAGTLAGNADAASALQGSASDYLSQARLYDPESYNRIFAQVTQELTNLSSTAISENQQLINAANAQIDILTSAQNALSNQVTETVIGNVISDTNRQKLEDLLKLTTEIETKAEADRAIAKAKLDANEANLAAIKDALGSAGTVGLSLSQLAQAMADTGLLATSGVNAAASLTGISAEVSASNDEIVAELKSINDNLQTLINTVIEAASADMATQNAIAASLIGAISSKPSEAPAIV